MKKFSPICLTLFISFFFGNESAPFFRASQAHPYHLSIGAAVFDHQGRIGCHHFKEIFGYKDIYILMRESMEDDETPFMTLSRGLQEEFGVKAEPIAFLGSLSGHLPDLNLPFEKTTLYILCKLTSFDPKTRDLEDPEGSSTIKWLEPDLLISLMQEQGARFPHRVDADESEIVRRAAFALKNQLKNP